MSRAKNKTAPNAKTKEKKSRGRRPEIAPDWAPKFIGALMQGCSVKDAAFEADIDLSVPYRRRTTDEEFKLAWQEAADIGTEFLEQEAARRAYHGTVKPVFHQGEQCGAVREYSDTLMIFLLKSRNPQKYREGVEDGGRNMIININVETKAPDAVLVEGVVGDGGQQDGAGLPEAAGLPRIEVIA